jgi:hypothetical protein
MNIYYAIILSVLFALTAIAFVFRKRMDASSRRAANWSGMNRLNCLLPP